MLKATCLAPLGPLSRQGGPELGAWPQGGPASIQRSRKRGRKQGSRMALGKGLPFQTAASKYNWHILHAVNAHSVMGLGLCPHG